MPKLLTAIALAMLTLAPVAAQAYDEPDRCYTPSDPRCNGDLCGNTFYNPTVSANWQRTVQAADPQVMQQLAGVYYLKYGDPTGQMVNEAYRSYEPGGLWQYTDQTCPVNDLGYLQCSKNQGAGQWAAYQQQDGSIFLMIHFSDLSRSNACFSQTILRLDRRGFSDAEGGNWQRVR